MPNELRDAISPYLRSHAENPVDWHRWGPEAFAEAERRDVPVLVSIGYSTCHWCHVMARESFSDPELAASLNERFVAIKVDREEHPDVDASYLAAASAFTSNLGWPLTVFTTPAGRAFYAGTYYPPTPVADHPSFRQVLDAVTEAWRDRREQVESTAAEIRDALAAATPAEGRATLSPDDLRGAVRLLAGYEDLEFGGFGTAPKFPVAPVIGMLVRAGEGGDDIAAGLARRTLDALATSPLRDPVDGGFFRYAVRRDWHEPHYERMLYDNALLLEAFSRVEENTAAPISTGIVAFLLDTLQQPRGGFGSAQDSESLIDGRRNEGGWYALDGAGRAVHPAPAIDDKVLTGWNGLAIGALAEAGRRLARPAWITAAERSADYLLDQHRAADGTWLRASTARGTSSATATLEDFGMLAHGLLRLALATGRVVYAAEARALVDACLAAGAARGVTFAAPGGGDPVLAAQGTMLSHDPSEGAYPSGLSAIGAAAILLSQLTASHPPGSLSYRGAAEAALSSVAKQALDNPIGFGAALANGLDLAAEATQVVVIGPEAEPVIEPEAEREQEAAEHGQEAAVALGPVGRAALDAAAPGRLVAVVTHRQAEEWATAGFDLFEGRATSGDRETAYVCRDFVCQLPVTDAEALREQLAGV